MKYLTTTIWMIALFSFFMFHAEACMNSISPADAVKVSASNDPSVAESLTYKGEDKVCFDGLDLRVAEYADNMVLDFIRKEKVDSCVSVIPEPIEGEEPVAKSECQLKLEALVCLAGKPIMTETEVYCAVEILKKDGQKLVESPIKKAAKEAAEKVSKDAEIAKQDKCKNFSFKGKTIAELRQELNDERECK